MTDPIADLLIRIKNAQMVGKKFVRVPFSKMKLAILLILEKNNLVGKIKKKGKGVKKILEVELKYQNNQPLIKEVKRISKPSLRVYAGYRDLTKFSRKGLILISTPCGLKTLAQARKEKIGGEVLFQIK
ncbi:30S ribosomal protein S8 [bacterium]|nr:30S ribosomal protein S8 [bacterium]